MSTEQHIEKLERDALDSWSGGNARAYLMHADSNITYFDDIGANFGLQGIDAVKSHFDNFADEVPAHNYELSDINAQVLDSTAILSYTTSALSVRW